MVGVEGAMSTATKIEWTRGDDGSAGATWNPVTGCTKVSAGCDHCYAEMFAERWRGVRGHPYERGFDLRLWPERLQLPFRWRKPRRVFVNSMSDTSIGVAGASTCIGEASPQRKPCACGASCVRQASCTAILP
jgi:protein gp37